MNDDEMLEKLEEEFLSNIKKSESITFRSEPCWIWTGYFSGGHGRFRLPKASRISACKFSFVRAGKSTSLTKNLYHLCVGESLCVNPEHMSEERPKHNNYADTKLLLTLSNQIITEIEIQRKEYLQKGSALSRLGMIRILIREALAVRRFMPKNKKDVDGFREIYDKEIKIRTNILDADNITIKCVSKNERRKLPTDE